MEPNLCSIEPTLEDLVHNLSLMVQQGASTMREQGNFNGRSYTGYQELPPWNCNAYTNPYNQEWNQSYGRQYQERPLSPPPYYDTPQESTLTQDWPHELQRIPPQQDEFTKSLNEILANMDNTIQQMREDRIKFEQETWQARQQQQNQFSIWANLEEESTDVVSQIEEQKSGMQKADMIMNADEDESEAVDTESVGEIDAELGEIIPCEVEQTGEKEEEVPNNNNNSTPIPLRVEESTLQPDDAIHFDAIDPFDQYMEDISDKIGMMVIIRK